MWINGTFAFIIVCGTDMFQTAYGRCYDPFIIETAARKTSSRCCSVRSKNTVCFSKIYSHRTGQRNNDQIMTKLFGRGIQRYALALPGFMGNMQIW